MRTRSVVAALLVAAVTLPALATPVAAGVPPAAAYAVVRDAANEDGYIVEGKDVFNSMVGRVGATKTEPGSVEVRFSTWPTGNVNVLVTSLSAKPRACAVGDWSLEATHLAVFINCNDRHGIPTDTPFIVSIRSLRAGHGHVAYLHANNPGLAGYIPDSSRQMNGTSPTADASIAKVDAGLWEARLIDLAAPGGTVQVSSVGGTGVRCGTVSWAPDGDDELVRVRCRDLDGDPANVQFTLWYARAQSLGSGLDRKQTYLFAHRPKAASYHPKLRFTSESGAATVTRQAKGRWTVTLPGMPKGGAAHVTPVGDGTARCNVSSIRRNALPQKVGVRCWNAAGQPANAKFTLAYLR